jgi:hypothetical protein
VVDDAITNDPIDIRDDIGLSLNDVITRDVANVFARE